MDPIPRSAARVNIVILLFALPGVAGGQCCAINWSFERVAGSCFGANCGCSCVPDSYSTENWTSCPNWGCGSTDIGPNPGGDLTMGSTPATHGASYLSMTCGGGPGGAGEGISMNLCPGSTLVAGTEYCFALDLVTRTNDGFICPPFTFNCPGVSRLVIYGSSTACDIGETLWESPTVGGDWATYQFCFTPASNWSFISFRVLNPTSVSSSLGLDNWRVTNMALLSNGCPLPVELSVFQARPRGTVVALDWTTLTETNSSHFEVQRSLDARDFEPVGRTKSAGHSQRRIDYRFTDHAPLPGISYYRLEQTDADGARNWSWTVAVEMGPDATVLGTWPNPADDHVRAVFPAGEEGMMAWRIADPGGRVLREGTFLAMAGMNTVTIPLAGLDAGGYFLQLLGTHGLHLGTARIVKR